MGSGLDLPVVSNSSRRACHRPPRDGAALASCRLPGILALEIEAPTRPAQCSSRGSSVDPRDEYCQSVVGRTAGSWRTPQAWDRRWADQRSQIHGAEEGTSVAGLEDLISAITPTASPPWTCS